MRRHDQPSGRPPFQGLRGGHAGQFKGSLERQHSGSALDTSTTRPGAAVAPDMGVPISGRAIKQTVAHHLEGVKEGTSGDDENTPVGVILQISCLSPDVSEDDLIGEIQQRAGRVQINKKCVDKGRPKYVEILRPKNLAFLYFTTAADMVFAGKAIRASSIWDKIRAANGSMTVFGKTTRIQLQEYLGNKVAKEHINGLPFRPWQDECPEYREKNVCINFTKCDYNHTLEGAQGNTELVIPAIPGILDSGPPPLSRPATSSARNLGVASSGKGYDTMPSQQYPPTGTVTSDSTLTNGQQQMSYYRTEQQQNPAMSAHPSHVAHQYGPHPMTDATMMDGVGPLKEDEGIDMEIEALEEYNERQASGSTAFVAEPPFEQSSLGPIPPPPPLPPSHGMMRPLPSNVTLPGAPVTSMFSANGLEYPAPYGIPPVPVLTPPPAMGMLAEPLPPPLAPPQPPMLPQRAPFPHDYEIGEAVWRGHVNAMSDNMQQRLVGHWTFRPAGTLPYVSASSWPRPMVVSPRKVPLTVCMDMWDRAPYEARRLFYILAEPRLPDGGSLLDDLRLSKQREDPSACLFELLEPNADMYVVSRGHAAQRKLVPLCPMPPCLLVGLLLPRM